MTFIEKSLRLREKLRQFILGWLDPKTLNSERARAELNAVLKKHWDPQPIEIYELILENWESNQPPPTAGTPSNPDKRFIVFIDQDLDVDWIANEDLPSDAEKCVSLAESIGARRCKHLPREQILELKRLIGQAIVNGIRGHKEESCKLAEDAAQFLKERTVERSRGWTLTAAHIFLLLFSALLTACCDAPSTWHCWGTADWFPLWLAIQGCVIGAYLSVLQKAGSGEWDAASGLGLHFLEVFTKLLAGGLLGGIALALSRSVHAPASIKNIAPDTYSVFLFGVAAGLFERVIPKMISTYSEFPTNTKDKVKE